MDSTIPREVALGYIKYIAECESGSKAVSSLPPPFLLQFPPLSFFLGFCK